MKRLGHFVGELRLARARFALDQQRALERDRRVDSDAQIVGRNIARRAFELLGCHRSLVGIAVGRN